MLSKVTKRYSLALYEAAVRDKKLDIIAEDSNNIIGLVKSSKDLRLFFASPVIKKAKKIKVVEAIFADKVSQLSFEFLKLLVNHNRENLVKDILDGFLFLKYESEGKVKAFVKTAVKMDDEEIKKIKEKIDGFTGKNSLPEFTEDNSLIGGFTVQVDDIVLDASIKRQLENLKSKFKGINIK